jgi:hypothetical protein
MLGWLPALTPPCHAVKVVPVVVALNTMLFPAAPAVNAVRSTTPELGFVAVANVFVAEVHSHDMVLPPVGLVIAPSRLLALVDALDPKNPSSILHWPAVPGALIVVNEPLTML